jgi:hypothetical protein
VQAQRITHIVEPDGVSQLRVEHRHDMTPRRKCSASTGNAGLSRQIWHEMGRNEVAELAKNAEIGFRWAGMNFVFHTLPHGRFKTPRPSFPHFFPFLWDGSVGIQQVGRGRKVALHPDEDARAEEEKLDGCYVIKSDLRPDQITKEDVHARYKDLAFVEQAFRTSKTVELEMRPIHVRKEESTRGHALVVMLAYRLAKELGRRWVDLDLTVGEGIKQLGTLCLTEVMSESGKVLCSTVPVPRPELAEIIARSGIALPSVIKRHGAKVATKKKLQNNRINRS